ncbi:MAG: diguanylate cyclase [Sulfurimonas sp.]|nr:diguanylate cyclase [Sulfurimonas sp.]
MSRWYGPHIRDEILFWFIIVSIIPIITLFSINYFFDKNQFKSQAKERLELILNEKISKLEYQIEDIEKSSKLIASFPDMVNSFLKHKDNFEQNNHLISDDEKLNKILNNLTDKDKFYDIFFIDMDGNIIYSLKKESDLGTNLLTGIHKDTNLASVYKDAKMFLNTKISSFEYYLPSEGHAAFVAHPIYNEDKIIGIVAIQLAKDRLSKIFDDQKGLGESGEFFASTINSQNKLISTTPLKYIKNSVENEFKFNENKELASLKAARGGYGSGEGLDYRGVEVITAWGYIPALNWGVVAKIDLDEVLKPIHKTELISIAVILVVLVFIAIAIIMATKHIVFPIDALTKRVKEFSLENQEKSSVDVYVDNEIGVLARNFNKMAKKLKNSQNIIKKYAIGLEDKVRERTKELESAKNELSKTNDSMKIYLDIVDKYIISSSTDLNGVITEVSSAFCNFTGYAKSELIGKRHNIMRHHDTPDELYREMWEALQRNETWRGEIINTTKEGKSYWTHATISPIYNASGEKIGYTSLRYDITAQKITEELSITDQLTQLYNRLKLKSVFDSEIERTSRYGQIFSVIMLDIDHFKSVNDTYGHNIGDKTLIDVAKILKKSSRITDIVGRWGGEEFIIVLPQTDIKAAAEHAEILRAKIEQQRFEAVGRITSSFGVNSFIEGDTSETIVKRADDALYEAKNSGRNRVCIKES